MLILSHPDTSSSHNSAKIHIQSENEARCNVKTFDGLQAQPRFHLLKRHQLSRFNLKRTIVRVEPSGLCWNLICVTVRFVLFSTVMLNFSTSGVLRTDVTWHQHRSQASTFGEPAHRQTVFLADALRLPIPARSDCCFRTLGISYQSLLHKQANQSAESEKLGE